MTPLKQNFETYKSQIMASVAQNRAYPLVPYATFEAWITTILTNIGGMIDAAEPATPLGVLHPTSQAYSDDYFLPKA